MPGAQCGAGATAAEDTAALRLECPLWRIWVSDEGRLYATRPGISALARGASVTVDALTADGLREAIAQAEAAAAQMAAQSPRPATPRGTET